MDKEKTMNNNKLIEIQSLHEQREIIGNPEVVVKEGVWIEIINFVPETEAVEILRRFEVIKIEKSQIGDIKKYKVTCKTLNIKEAEESKRKVARLVLSKHMEKLKASFAKCLIDGIESRSIQHLKSMSNKLNIYKEVKNDNK